MWFDGAASAARSRRSPAWCSSLSASGARWERLRPRLHADLLHDAVDPTEAERFVDGIVVCERRLPACLRVKDDPDLFLSRVIPLEPGAPGRARGHLKRFPDLHEPRDGRAGRGTPPALDTSS